jgi:hypothetical protein
MSKFEPEDCCVSSRLTYTNTTLTEGMLQQVEGFSSAHLTFLEDHSFEIPENKPHCQLGGTLEPSK